MAVELNLLDSFPQIKASSLFDGTKIYSSLPPDHALPLAVLSEIHVAVLLVVSVNESSHAI
jgi:hypothetical protein